jgi:NADPH:quinone reductase-like Zn-dependent oxidoreductase
MKAWFCHKYGSADHFQLKETPIPSLKDHDILVKNHAVSLNSWDWEVVRGKPLIVRMVAPGGWRKPTKVLGSDISGVVEEVGKNVKRFKPGDAVFGDLSAGSWGGFAEYSCVPENEMAIKPEGISHNDAAALPQAGVMALIGMRKVGPGEKVLPLGAGGGAGSFAIQLGKMKGAVITGVDRKEKSEFMKELGAEQTLDYTTQDISELNGKFDLIIAISGDYSLWDFKRLLAPHGKYLMMGGSSSLMTQSILLGPLVSLFSKKSLGILAHKTNPEDLDYLANLMVEGKIRSVIDRIYPFEEVPQAIEKLGSGKIYGKVVVNLQS